EFAAVYEIARVLEDPKHPLTQRLAPILGLTHTPRTAPQESSTLLPLPRHFAAEEYDAELIRHYRDIVHIYPHQFLLPEEIFYHRLAERLLWMPVPHPPQVYGYQTQADIYAPDIRKQKVYLLFDTSASMQTHHRIQLAKAIAYVFLRRNQAELGEIFLRTFDLAVGELHHAYDRPSFERLLRTVLRLQAVGQGTILEQAIRTAVEDIRHRTSLVHSEILVITDGIAYLHVDRVRELLGTDIRLHAVRLGHGQLKLKAKAVEDFVYRDDSEASRLYRKLQDEKRHLERQLVHVSGEQQRRLLQNQLHSLQQQCEALLAQMEQQAYRHYATALQQLCVVYVPVEDMPPSQLVGLPAERREALERAARRLLEQLQHSPTAEDFRTAAVVAEYLSFLSRCCAEAAALQGLAQQLRRHVEQALQEGEYRVAEQRVRLNREERRMLRALGAVSKASLSQLLRWLSVRYWLRRLRAWIQRSVWRLRWRFR
ncbi:MAG: VWA domain-containing protein, partial [Bacteroidota bacterium]|nr:VWA domain-containing protein [Bacteroidota bacterium]